VPKEVAETFLNVYPHKAWWNPKTGDGIKESLKLIQQQILKYGPYDGILGFSQGTQMAIIWQKHSELDPKNYPSFKFAINFCGVSISNELIKNVFNSDQNFTLNNIIALNIHGENDAMVDSEKKSNFDGIFVNKTVIVHSGKHEIPILQSIWNDIENFVQQQEKG